MIRRALVVAVAAVALSVPAAFASAEAALPAQPTATEKPFVDAIAPDLAARFPTASAAVRAGYIRYTDEDDTGAISYANRNWTSTDEKHPSQLWYDVKGRLLGADFSVPYAEQRPAMFGLDPMRWQRFGLHVHYGLKGPGGAIIFGSIGPKAFAKTGGDAEHPTAAMLVAAGIAKSPKDVAFVFTFPAIWDVSVWVLPNPAGAFADKNPDVKPVAPKPST
jgi:hypothetical protein